MNQKRKERRQRQRQREAEARHQAALRQAAHAWIDARGHSLLPPDPGAQRVYLTVAREWITEWLRGNPLAIQLRRDMSADQYWRDRETRLNQRAERSALVQERAIARQLRARVPVDRGSIKVEFRMHMPDYAPVPLVQHADQRRDQLKVKRTILVRQTFRDASFEAWDFQRIARNPGTRKVRLRRFPLFEGTTRGEPGDPKRFKHELYRSQFALETIEDIQRTLRWIEKVEQYYGAEP